MMPICLTTRNTEAYGRGITEVTCTSNSAHLRTMVKFDVLPTKAEGNSHCGTVHACHHVDELRSTTCLGLRRPIGAIPT